MSRLDIGRRVDEHVRPDTPALQGFAFTRCCGFSSASIPHALTGKVGSGSRRFRPHAVAYDLWLPPAGSIRDLHPPPFIHARRTQSPYGLLPIPPRSLSLPTYSCVDPPPPSTLISRGEVSHRGWHRGGEQFKERGFRLENDKSDVGTWIRSVLVSVRGAFRQTFEEKGDADSSALVRLVTAGDLGSRVSYWLEDNYVLDSEDSRRVGSTMRSCASRSCPTSSMSGADG